MGRASIDWPYVSSHGCLLVALVGGVEGERSESVARTPILHKLGVCLVASGWDESRGLRPDSSPHPKTCICRSVEGGTNCMQPGKGTVT